MLHKITSLVISLCATVFFAGLANAQVTVPGPASTAPKAPLGRLTEIFNETPSYNTATTESTLTMYIGQIINVVFGLLATIFIFLMVYAGYNWMTSSGDDKKVSKAQETIKTSIIGLIVTAGSYAIWQFLFVKVLSN